MTKRWERSHANGWTATVQADGEFFNTSAHEVGVPAAQACQSGHR